MFNSFIKSLINDNDFTELTLWRPVWLQSFSITSEFLIFKKKQRENILFFAFITLTVLYVHSNNVGFTGAGAFM